LPYVVHAFTIDDRASIRKFLDVPVTIYADDPAWVQPLYVDQLEKLSTQHPYFEHARARFWIISKNDQMIGRISAQIDQLNALSDHQKIGFMGISNVLMIKLLLTGYFRRQSNGYILNHVTSIGGHLIYRLIRSVGC